MRFINEVLLDSPSGGPAALSIYSGVPPFPKLLSFRDGKTLFFGGGLPVGDRAYGIELQEGDTIGVVYID